MKIKIVKELPQWIIVSDVGAYHPATRTIWIKENASIFILLHEIGHHIIEILTESKKIHQIYDRLTQEIIR